MIAKRMRIDLPRRRRGSAGSMSGSCGIILVAMRIHDPSRLVGLGLQMVQPQGVHERADGRRRTWRPRVLTPGMPSLDPGVERFVVRGGGLLGVEIMPGDRIEVATLEGGQAATDRPDGRDCRHHSGLGRGRPSLRTSAPCCLSTARMQPAFEAARRRGLDLGMVKAIRLFGGFLFRCRGAFTVGDAGYLLVAPARRADEPLGP